MNDFALTTIPVWSQYDAAAVTTALGQLDGLRFDVDRQIEHAVARARVLGLSWTVISAELNMSRQAAWERYKWLDPKG